ncbi:hypothetical protein [Streptomyces sp. NPDC008001]|uniref:hypothetical protein n=1 Tax=Streptomyces sp. NPDC008001 TaxID=3364804 RepID=UPI0036E41852
MAHGGNDGQAVFWDVATPGQHYEPTRRGDNDTFDDVADRVVLPGSGTLVIGTARRPTRLWDLTNPHAPQLDADGSTEPCQ